MVAVSNKIKIQYEDEIMRLRRELDQLKRRVPNAPEEMMATRAPPNLKAKNGRGDDVVDDFVEGGGPKRQKQNLTEPGMCSIMALFYKHRTKVGGRGPSSCCESTGHRDLHIDTTECAREPSPKGKWMECIV